jgi:hypothetical protein
MLTWRIGRGRAEASYCRAELSVELISNARGDDPSLAAHKAQLPVRKIEIVSKRATGEIRVLIGEMLPL